MQMRHHQELCRTTKGHSRLVRLVGCLVVALAALLAPVVALAAEDGSLTLVVEYESGGTTTRISGATAAAYRVADLDDGINTYTLRDEFASLGVDFNLGMDAETMEATAEAAARIVQAGGIEGVSATSGADGVAAFGTLPKGVYLVVQTDATDVAAEYEDLTPFLISVPEVTAEGIVYDVVAYPKVTPGGTVPSKDEEPPDDHTGRVTPPPTPKTPKTNMPQTGDLANPALWVSCCVAGALLIMLGRAGLRRVRTNVRDEA